MALASFADYDVAGGRFIYLFRLLVPPLFLLHWPSCWLVATIELGIFARMDSIRIFISLLLCEFSISEKIN